MESEQNFRIVDIVDERVEQEQKNILKRIKNQTGEEEIELWKSLFPFDLIESVLVLLMRLYQLPPLGTQDFLAQSLYFINHNEYKKLRSFVQETITMFELIEDEEEDEEKSFKYIRELSIIVRFVVRELKNLNLDPLQILKAMYIDDEFIKALLSGEKDELLKYKDWKINYPEEIKEKTNLAFAIFVQLYGKLKIRNISNVREEIPFMFLCTNMIIIYRVYKNVRSEYPEDYRAWRNYAIDNALFFCDIYDRNNPGSGKPILLCLEFLEMNYKNYLDNFFDVIYNRHYTKDYRANIRHLLETEECVAILPYYEEYCKEHNISSDKYYNLGIIPNKHEKKNSLSYIDTESPDKDINQHFCLVLKSSEVECLYNELKGTYLSADTDIRLFCYRLTGKAKPDNIEKLNWIVDDDSLAFFIKELGVSNADCWKKTELFFGHKANNLKTIYCRLSVKKGNKKSTIIRLKEILDNTLRTK